jgi:RNA polymerase-binding protein DksA
MFEVRDVANASLEGAVLPSGPGPMSGRTHAYAWRLPMNPLSDRQRDELQERLASRRQALRAEIQRELANSDDPRVTGFMNQLAATEDWVLADILTDLDIATVTRDVAELAEVDAALVRITDGSYGTCSDCGEPIGWPRLNAQPTAGRCIACQQRLEGRSGRPGPPSL